MLFGITAHGIRTDIGKIRRFKIEIVLCGCCTNKLKCTVRKTTGGRGERGEGREKKKSETEKGEIKM